jgi:2-keto-3-deoxy-L-rhamnonate aldolase RhmA
MPNIANNLPTKNDVQAVLIAKEVLTLNEARRLISKMKYFDYGVRETNKYWRFRQFNPTDRPKIFKRSKDYPGVSFIIEY